MAQATQREYTIPLRREWMKVVRYKRTRRSVKAIKAYIARHMKVPERDVSKVKLDVYLNNELWFRGAKSPPTKIRVLAKKEGDKVMVTFVETPERIKFAQKKHEKLHKKTAKKKVEKAEKKEEPTEEEKTIEAEKEKAVAESGQVAAHQEAKVGKHVTQTTQKQPIIHRKALQK